MTAVIWYIVKCSLGDLRNKIFTVFRSIRIFLLTFVCGYFGEKKNHCITAEVALLVNSV